MDFGFAGVFLEIVCSGKLLSLGIFYISFINVQVVKLYRSLQPNLAIKNEFWEANYPDLIE